LHVTGTLLDSADDENGLPSPNLVYGEKAYKVFEVKASGLACMQT